VSLPAWQEGEGKGRGGLGKGRAHKLEDQFCVSSLCFKTDRVTVEERVELMERQRNIANASIKAEITNFGCVLQQLSDMGYRADMQEVLQRLAGKMAFLRDSSRQLAVMSESLGAVRQETRVADMVNIITDYVNILTEKHQALHDQLVDARMMINKNHIVVKVVDKPVAKSRSVSLMSPATSSLRTERKASLGLQVHPKAKPVEAEPGQDPSSGLVRKRTRKCSQFASISEDCSPSPPSALLPPVRRKSSKKVSIAENLNCDYSDDNLSDVGTGDCLGVEGESPMGDQGLP